MRLYCNFHDLKKIQIHRCRHMMVAFAGAGRCLFFNSLHVNPPSPLTVHASFEQFS